MPGKAQSDFGHRDSLLRKNIKTTVRDARSSSEFQADVSSGRPEHIAKLDDVVVAEIGAITSANLLRSNKKPRRSGFEVWS